MKLLSTVYLLVCPVFLFAQELISEASRLPITDSAGDPLNNILDPNGARQGTWYFDDFQGNLVMVETYQDNIRLTRQLAVENNESTVLLDEGQYGLLDGAQMGVTASTLGLTLQSDQQLGALVDHSGIIQVIFIGNWNPAAISQATTSTEQWFATHGIVFNQNYSHALVLVQ
jgi:hypothetical protein